MRCETAWWETGTVNLPFGMPRSHTKTAWASRLADGKVVQIESIAIMFSGSMIETLLEMVVILLMYYNVLYYCHLLSIGTAFLIVPAVTVSQYTSILSELQTWVAASQHLGNPMGQDTCGTRVWLT